MAVRVKYKYMSKKNYIESITERQLNTRLFYERLSIVSPVIVSLLVSYMRETPEIFFRLDSTSLHVAEICLTRGPGRFQVRFTCKLN